MRSRRGEETKVDVAPRLKKVLANLDVSRK